MSAAIQKNARTPARLFNGRTSMSLASKKRLADAYRLLEPKSTSKAPDEHARGAAYLAGYAVECRIKAIAMEIFGCWTLDELASKWNVPIKVVYDHSLEALARRLPSYAALFRNKRAYHDFVSVNSWSPSWRYDGRDWTTVEAKKFVEKVLSVLGWLEANS